MANDHTIDVKVRANTTELSKGLSKAEQERRLFDALQADLAQV